MRHLLLALVVAFTLPAFAGIEEGKEAYMRKDFVTAEKEWLTSAQSGEAESQFLLAALYYENYGVPQDYSKALYWFGQAANQGFANAQYKLGAMYFWGHGVPQDYVQARKWMALAVQQGDHFAFKTMRLLRQRMTDAEVEESQRLIVEWQAAHAKR